MTEEVDFAILKLDIPLVINTYPIELQREIFDYLSELDDINRIAYKIAFNHLKSYFDISRSNGFIKWKQQKLTK